MPEDEVGLTGFLGAAGQSLASAQGELSGGEAAVPSIVAIAEAELEVKATLDRDGGAVGMRPISSSEATQGQIDPALLSTVRVRYVPVSEEGGAAQGRRPARTASWAIERVKRREDVVALGRILGGLSFEATFVPSQGRWLVTARDPAGRLVRETIVPEDGG